MRKFLGIALLLAFTATRSFSQVEIDHVILVTENLKETIRYYDSLGFEITPGRLHSNGLENVFIKFQSGPEIEMMSISQAPTDDLSNMYTTLIDKGINGAFLCLTGDPIKTRTTLTSAGIEFTWTSDKYWNYLNFSDPNFGHLFFIFYESNIKRAKSILHSNEAIYVRNITIDGNEEVQKLFAILLDSEIKDHTIKSGDTSVKFTPFEKGIRPEIRRIEILLKSGKLVKIDL